MDVALSRSRASTLDHVRAALAGRTDKAPRFGCEPKPAGEATTDQLPPDWTNTPDGRKIEGVEATQLPPRQLGSRNSQPWCDGKRHRIPDRPRFGVPSSCDEAVGARHSRCARDRPVVAESQSHRKPAGTNLPEKDARSTACPEGQSEWYSDFRPKRDCRSRGDPGLCTDSQRELLLRSLPCASAGVVLRLAHLHVELEAAGLKRDAAHRSVRHEDETRAAAGPSRDGTFVYLARSRCPRSRRTGANTALPPCRRDTCSCARREHSDTARLQYLQQGHRRRRRARQRSQSRVQCAPPSSVLACEVQPFSPAASSSRRGELATIDTTRGQAYVRSAARAACWGRPLGGRERGRRPSRPHVHPGLASIASSRARNGIVHIGL